MRPVGLSVLCICMYFVQIYKQRVKHLLYEHQNESTTKRTDAQVALKLAEDDHRDSELELQKDKRALERMRKELQVRHEEYVKELKQQHDRDITMLRLEFERESRDLCAQYESALDRARKQLTEKRTEEVRRIEARKSKHIAALIEAHDKAFQDIKAYFSEITHANLDLIRSLKDEVNELAQREQDDEKRIIAIAQENKRMSAPLARALEESARLKEEKAQYLQDMELLNKLKARVLIQEDATATLQWEHEVLEQRLARVKKERDELYSRFASSLYDVQQKAGFRNLLLEKKLEAAAEEVEKKGAALGEVLAAAKLDPTTLGAVEDRLEDVVQSKDSVIRELKVELQRVIAAHSRVLDAYGNKLDEYGIPTEELGFEPMRLVAVQAADAAALRVTHLPGATSARAATPAMREGAGSRASSAEGASRSFRGGATFTAAPMRPPAAHEETKASTPAQR